jgi:hypothetical protein
MASSNIPPDPNTVLDSLDPDRIVSRLQELEQEARALRVLLRAARTRQRQRARDQRGKHAE